MVCLTSLHNSIRLPENQKISTIHSIFDLRSNFKCDIYFKLCVLFWVIFTFCITVCTLAVSLKLRVFLLCNGVYLNGIVESTFLMYVWLCVCVYIVYFFVYWKYIKYISRYFTSINSGLNPSHNIKQWNKGRLCDESTVEFLIDFKPIN